MTNYIQVLIDQLKSRRSGMNDNAPLWVGQPVTTLDLDGFITVLEGLDNEIEAAKDLLQQKRTNAREAVTNLNKDLAQVDNLARGLHKSTPEKLSDYDIKLPKTPVATALPVKAIIKSIADDDDGIGFKITVQSQGRNVTTWEVQRGEIVPATNTGGGMPPANPGTPASGSPSATVLQPPYPFLRTTKKLVFVDDDVETGVRYFYRLRGTNSKGAGEWSEPVSAVQ
jgi:hypothetical protein